MQAVALAAREQGLAALIVMPENAPPVKVRRARRLFAAADKFAARSG